MSASDNDRDLRQLAGRFDDPVTPATYFAERLRARLGERSSQPIPNVMVAPTVAHRRAEALCTPIPSMPARSRPARNSRPFRLAAAVLAILVVVSGFALMLQPDEPLQLLYQPNLAGTSLDVNYAGTPGRTWEVSDRNPIVGQAVRSHVLDGWIGPTLPIIVNGSVFYTDYSGGSFSQEFVRVDLSTGELVWRKNLSLGGSLASDGEYLYAFWALGQMEERWTQLVAIHVDTGDLVWRGPSLANRQMNAGSIIVDGDSVFAIDYLGNAVRVDRLTGEAGWQFPKTLREPTTDDVQLTTGGSFGWPLAALAGDALFIVRPSLNVVRIDRGTGQEAGIISTVDQYAAGAQDVDLLVSESYLVVIAQTFVENQTSPSSSFTITPAELLVFDLATMELNGRRSLQDLRGNISVTGDTAFVPRNWFDTTYDAPTADSQVVTLDLATMEEGLTYSDLGQTRKVWTSIAGDVLILADGQEMVIFLDIDSFERVGEVTIPFRPSEVTFGQPVLMAGSLPVVVGRSGEIFLLSDDLPSGVIPASSTPVDLDQGTSA